MLDFFIVNVSIPAIEKNLKATDSDIQLTIAAYGLIYAVCLITGGRLGDLFGRKRMFMIGIGGFTLASGLCGLAQSPDQLIAARVLQGFTGALMFPQVLSIIQVTFPPRERVMAFSILGAVVGTGSFLGNVVGGLLVSADVFGLTWRPIFLVNLPVGLCAFIAAGPLVRESRSEKARKLDLGGVALATLSLLLLIYPLVEGREQGWPLWAFLCLGSALPSFVVFILYERQVEKRGGSPLIELSLFHDRVFVIGLLTTLAYNSGLSAFFLMVTMFMQQGLGFNAREAGLTFAPFALGFVIASWIAVKLTPYLGSRVINLGALLMAVGLLTLIILSQIYGSALGSMQLIPALLLYGTGQGLVMPTLVSTVLTNIPGHAAGSASGVLTTVQQVAVSLGVAVIPTVYFTILGPKPTPAEYGPALGICLPFNVVLLALTFGLALLLPHRVVVHEAAAAEAAV